MSLAKAGFILDESFSVPQIEMLLNDSLLCGGKRMRPLFTLLMGELLGLSFEQIKNCAISAELTHAAFLAHDDVIDKADERRGLKTINSRTDNKLAILAGDALLARVCEIVVEEPSREIMKDLAWTIRQTVEGEWLQMESKGIAPLTLAHIEEVGFKKTGALLVWCARSAAHMSSQSSDVIELCSDLGKLLGVAFQLTDDVIDYLPTSGKEFAKDYNERLVNSVTCLMMENDRSLIDHFRLTDRPLVSVDSQPWTKDNLHRSMSAIRERARLKLSLAEACVQKIFEIQQSKLEPSQKQIDAKTKLLGMIQSMRSREV